MRLFIAVEIPGVVQEELTRCIKDLVLLESDVRWAASGNLHITIKFLGRVDPSKLDAVRAALQNLAAKIKPFTARLSSLGAFPDHRDPQIIWAGVEEGQAPMQKLAALVDDAMKDLGFESEHRGYTAHVTLGRTRSKKNLNALSQALSERKFQSQHPFTVTGLTLFESITDPKGAIYKVVGRAFTR